MASQQMAPSIHPFHLSTMLLKGSALQTSRDFSGISRLADTWYPPSVPLQPQHGFLPQLPARQTFQR
jgi:hypothetical protein